MHVPGRPSIETYFTSDTHFGHAQIIKLCKRPFVSVEEMDEALIANWNAVVRPEDRVFHLGDVCFRNSTSADRYVSRLNGTIHLIAGNHDEHTLKHHRDLFATVREIHEVKCGHHRLLLCHYPMREWPGAWRGAWHLFGHVHGRLDDQPFGPSMDVGVDSHQFRPIGIAEIVAALENRPNPFAG